MQRYGINLDENVIKEVDNVRGLIPRSRFINATLEQKVEQIRENGGVLGQI